VIRHIGLLVVTAALLVASLGGCLAPRDQVEVENIAGTTRRVVERHDAYVRGDVNLDAAARELALGQSAAVLGLLELEKLPRTLLERDLPPVLSRHDAYVRADVQLLQIELDSYLASTDALRAVLRPPD